jgi:hypothetical protein
MTDPLQTGRLYFKIAVEKVENYKGPIDWDNPNLSAHGLCKLGVQRCAEAGATEHQLMALFGWSNPPQAAVNTRKANPARLEASAARVLQGLSGNKSVPLFRAVASGGTIRVKNS